MSRKLKRITPTEMAIHIIDDTIRDLKEQRAELIAQLPKRRPRKKLSSVIRRPFTNEWWDYKKKCRIK